MKKLTKILAIILTLALLCACTSEVKQTSTSSVGSDAPVTSSSQEISSVGSDALVAPSSEPTSSDSIAETTQIVDEKYVRRAAEILSTKDLSLYYPKEKLDYFSVGYEINFLDITDDEIPELIVIMHLSEKAHSSAPPYVKTLIIDINTAELLTEFWGNFSCDGNGNYVKKTDDKFISYSSYYINADINAYLITEIENINGSLINNAKYAVYMIRNRDMTCAYSHYFYQNLTKEQAGRLYIVGENDFTDYENAHLNDYNEYIYSVLSGEDINLTNIGWYIVSFDEKSGETYLYVNIKEPYKYIESELKYPLS